MFYVVCNEKDCRIYTHMDLVKEDEKEGYKLIETKNTLEEAIEFVKKQNKPIGFRNFDPKKAFPN